MSLTFSDRGARRSETGFHRALAWLIGALSAIVLGVGGWSLVQGPQLRDIGVDESSLHQRAGAFVQLRADRAIRAVSEDQIRISPEAEYSLENDGVSLRLTFDEPLLADTTYTIGVSGVRPAGWGQEGSWSASFTTGGFDFLFLRDSADGVEVHRAKPGQVGSTVVYRASGITAVAPVASIIAALREDGQETWLELIDPDSGAAERVVLPPGYTLTDLANATWGTTLVAIGNVDDGSSSPAFGVLILVDVLSDRTPRVVEGISGSPLSVRSVAVSPQSGEILVWQKNQELVRFNPLTGIVLPVASASELWGFDSLGEQALFVDGLGTLAQNLSSGELTRVPRGELEGTSLRHQKFVMAPDGLRVHRAQLPGLGDGDPYSLVTREDAEGVHRFVTGSLDTPASIGDIGLSANGQFLLVEYHPESSPLGYQGLTGEQIARGTVIRVIDLGDDTLVGEFPGYGFVW